jgi:hypothetical protein
MEHEAGVDLSWINEDDGAEDFSPRMREMKGAQSRDLKSIARKDTRLQAVHSYLDEEKARKTAGKNFTQREQRELIDEDGVARNSDMLDLDGTHYDQRDFFDPKANSENVPDSHLFLGL